MIESCISFDLTGSSEWVYFSNRVDIRKISPDGTDYRIVVGGLRGVVSIDFHMSKKHIYWTDILTDQIQRATIENGKECTGCKKAKILMAHYDQYSIDFCNIF